MSSPDNMKEKHWTTGVFETKFWISYFKRAVLGKSVLI
jgi:hypothetical protein